MTQKDKPADTPLVVLEKEIEVFKKELEEKIKVWNKIEFKAKNLDREKYKESVTASVKELHELNEKCNGFIKRTNDLKKENELETLKEKDFEKRKANEIKKVKEYVKKIEKCLDHFKQDVVKLEKLENEELKKANKNNPEASTKTIESLAHIFQPKKEAIEDVKYDIMIKPDENKKEKESEDEDDEESAEDLENTDGSTKKSDAKGSALSDLVSKTLIPEQKEKKGLLALASADAKKSVLMNNDNKKNEESEGSEEEEEDEGEEEEDGENDEESDSVENDEVIKTYQNQLLDTNDKVTFSEPKAILKKNYLKKTETSDQKTAQNSSEKVDKIKLNQPSDDDDTGIDDDEDDDEVDDNESEELNDEVLIQKEKSKKNDSDDDEDNDDDYDETAYNLEVGTKFVVIKNFDGEQKGDLPLRVNDILTLIRISDKNWYQVKNQAGKEGLAPRNYIKVLLTPQAKLRNKIMLPQQSTDSNRSGLELWKVVKEQIKNKTLLDPEALKASGLIPKSFSSSQLEKLSRDPKYSYKNFLAPKLCNSNLMFSDFFWDLKANKLRTKLVSLQKVITINKCTRIPIPKSDDLIILGRFVRICLFDGKSILSNIHIVKARVESDETTWLFNSEVDSFAKIVECSEIFIRCQMRGYKSNLGILFELAMHGIKKSTNEETHVSCGWAHLPFIDEQKYIISNKGYDLILNGGGIFDEKGKPLNEDLARLKPNPSLLDGLIDKLFRESKIKFDVHVPSDKMTERLNCLPQPLVSSTILASFMRYYYEELASTLLKPSMEVGLSLVDITSLHSPFLASFIKSLEFPDILDAVQHACEKRKGLMSRDERNDETYRRKLFVELFTKIAYPILHNNEMPEIHLHDKEVMENRDEIIERHWQAVVKNTILKSLLSEKEEYEPFDIIEVSCETIAIKNPVNRDL